MLTTEKFADGLASLTELAAVGAVASEVAQAACDAVKVVGDVWQSEWVSAQAALTAHFAALVEQDGEDVAAADAAHNAVWHARVVAKQVGIADPLGVIRDIFGNPFRPVAFSPRGGRTPWLR